jgi:beta-glucanase (GH16 family)
VPAPPLADHGLRQFWHFGGRFPLRPATGDIYRNRAALNGDAATWAPRYQWTYHPGRGASAIRGWDAQGNPHPSSELQAYVNPFASAVHAAHSPFIAMPDHGVIRGQPRPDALARFLPQPYASGCMITRGSYALTHGWVEARLRLPRGKGLWPAFWLLPDDGAWPPEIDIMEAHGGDPTRYYATVHWGSPEKRQESSHPITGLPDLTRDWHQYAVHWGPEWCDFHFDRRQVARVATPPQLRGRACYLLLNLAIGCAWFGPPDETTPFPADLGIEWVGVWQRAEGW